MGSGRCLSTLEGCGGVLALAQLPDGRLASGSQDSTIRIWDVGSGRCLSILERHGDFVSALALLPDGQLVSGSFDKTIGLWDIGLWPALAAQATASEQVSAAAVSTLSSKMSSASNESETEVLRRQLAEQKQDADARIAKLEARMESAALKSASADGATMAPSIAPSALHIDKSKLLGRGGLGVVYAGTWQRAPVAIKQLHPTRLTAADLALFKEEGQRHAELRHPNVVTMYGVCMDSEHSLVMEFMGRGSLDHFLHSTRDILWSVKLSIARNIANGLYYLHENGVIHRDLKSPNVLLDQHGLAKLSDFGFATVKSSIRSTTAQAPGTVRWMAPELFARGGKCTPSTDIYALGWVLWELLSHKVPFEDEKHATDAVVIQWIKDGERESVPNNTPIKYSELLTQCWHQRNEARPTSVDVADKLDAMDAADGGYAGVSHA